MVKPISKKKNPGLVKLAKKKDGGMIKQAQRNYRGTYIDGSLGGVQVSNPSLKKYYKGML